MSLLRSGLLTLTLVVLVLSQNGPTGPSGSSGEAGNVGMIGAPGSVVVGPTGEMGPIGNTGNSYVGNTGEAGGNDGIQGSVSDQRFESLTLACSNSGLFVCNFDQTEWITVVNQTTTASYVVQAISSFSVKTMNVSITTPVSLRGSLGLKDLIDNSSPFCEGTARAYQLQTELRIGRVTCGNFGGSGAKMSFALPIYMLTNVPVNENWINVSLRLTYNALFG
jgi:hypothetical protein